MSVCRSLVIIFAALIVVEPVSGVSPADSSNGTATHSIFDLSDDAAPINLPPPVSEPPVSESQTPEFPDYTPKFYIDYDKGFILRPYNRDETPFEMKVRVRMQFRYSGFIKNIDEYSNRGDTARGGPILIENRNQFEIERGRLIFTGFMFDPKLKYFLNLDADTDENHRMVVHDFWVYYEFNDAFIFNIGKAMVPGSRDWLSLSPNTHLVDRSMATTFFRPDRTIGIWARGKLGDDLFYHALIGNGFNSTDRGPNDVDDRFVYSISSWWEPLGEVGKSHSDLKFHTKPVVRLGHSFTYASQGSRQDGTPHSEITFVRISDGTRLVTPEALAPGVSVNEYDIYLYSIDTAWKRCGFSFNAEYFLRWINEIKTTGGPSPYSELFAHGFYFDVGYFLLPKKFEVAGQVSYVSGEFGDSWEYAAGVNYFVQPTQFNKFTFDVTVLDGSPTASTSPNFFVGQSGVMLRAQYQIQF